MLERSKKKETLKQSFIKMLLIDSFIFCHSKHSKVSFIFMYFFFFKLLLFCNKELNEKSFKSWRKKIENLSKLQLFIGIENAQETRGTKSKN